MRLNQFSKNMVFGDNGFFNKHLPPDNEPAEDERKDTYNFLDLEKCRVSQGMTGILLRCRFGIYTELLELSVMGAETAGDIPDDGWVFITTGHMRDSAASAYTPYPDLFDRMDEESF